MDRIKRLFIEVLLILLIPLLLSLLYNSVSPTGLRILSRGPGKNAATVYHEQTSPTGKSTK